MKLIDQVFAVTESAFNAAKKKLESRGTPSALIRLGVKGGGCSGFSYVVQFDDGNPKESDFLIEEDGVKFVIDPKSLSILKGSTLDYVKVLIYEGFRFMNPQEATNCGCGSSFSLK